jgi:adenylate kinase
VTPAPGDDHASRRAGVAALVTVIVCWGLTWPVNKVLLENLSPAWMMALRSAVATVGLFAIALARGRLVLPRGDMLVFGGDVSYPVATADEIYKRLVLPWNEELRKVGASSKKRVLLGAPGCGKGTQAERLESALVLPAISTGDLLRQAVAQGTELGARVATTLASGGLVDDALMAEIVRGRIQRDDARDGFVLDGYPRTIGQAESLEEMLRQGASRIDSVLFLDVPEETLVRRALSRRREDDQEPVVRQRLALYRLKTEPLIEHYRRRGLLHRIDGDRPVESVTQGILAVLEGD